MPLGILEKGYYVNSNHFPSIFTRMSDLIQKMIQYEVCFKSAVKTQGLRNH